MTLERRTAEGAERPHLIGHVQSSDGRALKAAIFVSNAVPKVRPGLVPFSAYRDFQKNAKTDARGDFKIESLSLNLLFRILVVGEGCKPKFVGEIDPANGPVAVTLDALDLSGVPAELTAQGQIIDSTGFAIEGACVEVCGIHTRDGRLKPGNPEEVDPKAISDGQGKFVITSREPFASLDLKVNAAGFSPRIFSEVHGGNKTHKLTMTAGAAVKGRVVLEGKPLGGVTLGASSTEHGVFSAGNFETITDSEGRFEFAHLPPTKSYHVYGLMSSLATLGALPTSTVQTGPDGSATDTGELAAGPGYRLAGRVVLDDSHPLPAEAQCLVARDFMWDAMPIELDKDGSFDVRGIPGEVVALTVRVPGYGPSDRNASLDTLNHRIVGRVDHDITNLVILMEKGKKLDRERYASGYSLAARERRLRGAEPEANQTGFRSAEWTISGRVTDAGSGQPLAQFRVTPGNEVFPAGINLLKSRQARGADGAYVVQLSKRFSNPVLKFEADGYLPLAVTPPQEDRSNFDCVLQAGVGPSGTVLLPDGRPAANVTVALICSGDHYAIAEHDIVEAGAPRSHEEETRVAKSDAIGHFVFQPELQMDHVSAASPDGFAIHSIAEFSANPSLTLQPWARVKGLLIRPSDPASNETLDLQLLTLSDNHRWSLDTGNHTTTDDDGVFDFEHVPPGELELTYRVKQSERGWRNVPLRAPLTVSPGQTVDLRIEASERETGEAAAISFPQPPPTVKSGPPITGIVLLPSGEPAGGAEVGLVVKNEYLGLCGPLLQTGRDPSLKTTADAGGNFRLSGVKGVAEIIAVHEDGFAETFPEADGKPARLALRPWGKISGTLRIGGRIGANEEVVLHPVRFHDSFHYSTYRTKTDHRGRFVLNYVPPGEQQLCRMIPTDERSSQSGPPTFVDVKAGSVTEITISGTGRRVIGKAIPKTPGAVIDWSDVKFALTTPQHTPPRGLETLAEIEAWYETPEGEAAYRNMRHYKTGSASDGRFTIEDVQPGDYQLTISRERVETDKDSSGIRTIHRVVMLAGNNVTIPDVTGEEAAFDTGTTEVDLSGEFPKQADGFQITYQPLTKITD